MHGKVNSRHSIFKSIVSVQHFCLSMLLAPLKVLFFLFSLSRSLRMYMCLSLASSFNSLLN